MRHGAHGPSRKTHSRIVRGNTGGFPRYPAVTACGFTSPMRSQTAAQARASFDNLTTSKFAGCLGCTCFILPKNAKASGIVIGSNRCKQPSSCERKQAAASHGRPGWIGCYRGYKGLLSQQSIIKNHKGGPMEHEMESRLTLNTSCCADGHAICLPTAEPSFLFLCVASGETCSGKAIWPLTERLVKLC